MRNEGPATYSFPIAHFSLHNSLVIQRTAAVAAAKAAAAVSRRFRLGGGTALPGLVAERIDLDRRIASLQDEHRAAVESQGVEATELGSTPNAIPLA